jgi:hypothetical protein
MKKNKKNESVKTLCRRYEILAAKLANTGLILQGTITERTISRDDPEKLSKIKTYGPYYQWTQKKEGKTVTVNLTASQAKVYQKAIDNHRKMENILKQMRDISLQICEETTTHVKKRKTIK